MSREHHVTKRRVYVGKLDRRTRDRDVEDTFEKYGKVLAVDMKNGYAFVVSYSTLRSLFL